MYPRTHVRLRAGEPGPIASINARSPRLERTFNH